MAFKRSALVVAAAALARAQGNCPDDDTVTISATGVSNVFSGCPTYSGTIVIAPTETAAAIEVDGVRSCRGIVVEGGGNLQSLTMNNMQDVAGTWNMTGATALSTLSFPQINNVDVIRWTALAQLQGLDFGERGVETCNQCTIDNTQLNSLDGLNFQTLDFFSATNNPFLNDITMQLGNITQAFTVSANGGQMNVELPNLEWAFNLTLNGVASVNVQSLAAVNSSLSVNDGTLESFTAPNITKVGATLAFARNDNLNNVDMPMLTTVGGGLTASNNSKLSDFQLSELTSVGGAVDFDGAFTNVSLPAIKDVKGAFRIISDKDIESSCSAFESKAGSNQAIKGEFECSGNNREASTSTNADGTTTGDDSSTSSSGAASAYYVPSATTGLMGVLAAIFGLL